MKIMKQKSNLINKKAFTLVELLIVIAIIGILFIVLVSKVDFAVDKAKATGVQTDFRSFQMAFEQVARENNGFNTLGWDTGDTYIADRIRNSYDAGDTNQNGIQEAGEVWTGRMVYAENYTGVYTLTNPKDTTDKSAYRLLEAAINANLDPKLHITIGDDGSIIMANDARDPWKNNYQGQYITNASETDKLDRGAIVLFSAGPNGILNTEYGIESGIVSINNPGNSKEGADDYVLVTVYTYVNDYGEVASVSSGFSSNIQHNALLMGPPNGGGIVYNMLSGAQIFDVYNPSETMFRSEADYSKFVGVKVDGSTLSSDKYLVSEGSTIIHLDAMYVASLPIGDHEIEIVSEDGFAKSTLTIQNERGRYFGVPYVTTIDGLEFHIIFDRLGRCFSKCYENNNLVSVDVMSVTYDAYGKKIYVDGNLIASISNTGKTLTFEDPGMAGVTFTLESTNPLVFNQEYVMLMNGSPDTIALMFKNNYTVLLGVLEGLWSYLPDGSGVYINLNKIYLQFCFTDNGLIQATDPYDTALLLSGQIKREKKYISVTDPDTVIVIHNDGTISWGDQVYQIVYNGDSYCAYYGGGEYRTYIISSVDGMSLLDPDGNVIAILDPNS